MKKLLMLALVAVMLPLATVSATATTLDMGDPLEEYLQEQNGEGLNTIVLDKDIDKAVGKALTKELKKLYGKALKRSTVKNGKDMDIMYQFPALSNGSLSNVDAIINGTEVSRTGTVSTLAHSATSTRPCSRYHDYYYWYGRYLEICGTSQVKYYPRISALGWGNDDISSIYHSKNGIYTTLYEHDYYRGWGYGTSWDVGAIPGRYNNNASSLRVSFPGAW